MNFKKKNNNEQLITHAWFQKDKTKEKQVPLSSRRNGFGLNMYGYVKERILY